MDVLCCKITIGDANPSNPMEIKDAIEITEVQSIHILIIGMEGQILKTISLESSNRRFQWNVPPQQASTIGDRGKTCYTLSL